jgi:hypothetical protein
MFMFILVVPDVSNPQQAHGLRVRLQAAVVRPLREQDVSFGFTPFRQIHIDIHISIDTHTGIQSAEGVAPPGQRETRIQR